MSLNRKAMILVWNRVAMAAHSRGRKPTDSEPMSFSSRECGGSTFELVRCCRRIRGSKPCGPGNRGLTPAAMGCHRYAIENRTSYGAFLLHRGWIGFNEFSPLRYDNDPLRGSHAMTFRAMPSKIPGFGAEPQGDKGWEPEWGSST